MASLLSLICKMELRFSLLDACAQKQNKVGKALCQAKTWEFAYWGKLLKFRSGLKCQIFRPSVSKVLFPDFSSLSSCSCCMTSLLKCFHCLLFTLHCHPLTFTFIRGLATLLSCYIPSHDLCSSKFQHYPHSANMRTPASLKHSISLLCCPHVWNPLLELLQLPPWTSLFTVFHPVWHVYV